MGAPYIIVPELLTRENYGSWKIWMRNYLLGKELWDIVDGTFLKPDEATQQAGFMDWRKKNGKALHAIQVSCGPGSFSSISQIDTAKGAWDHLAFMNRQPFSDNPPQAPEPSSYPQGQNGDENTWRSVLYKAVVKGDWERTKNLLDSHPEGRSTRLSKGETILHTAVLCKHVQLVEEIVKLMTIRELEARLPYRDGATALHLAASGGVVKIAEPIVNKNRNLLCLKDNSDYLPVALAYAAGQKNMTKYLFSVIGVEELNRDRSHSGATMLTTAIMSQDYDFALEIHDRCPQLTTMPNVNSTTALETLAVMASAFPSGSQLRFWQKWIYNCINLQPTDAGNSEDSILTQVPGFKQMHDLKAKHMQVCKLLKRMSDQVSTFNLPEMSSSGLPNAVILASQFGNVEFVVEMVKSNPALLHVNTTAGGIFHVAVANRQEKIWNLIYRFGAEGDEFARFADPDLNTLLHVAGMLAPAKRLSNISGAAMQMQREMQWYKEVEMISPPLIKELANKAGKTGRNLFTEQHKDLVKEGEKWMKDTATSCMVVATLIATVMFAAAFTVPGGNDDQTGNPKFLQRDSFMLFIVSDAISLFSSATSVLMFLSILTSRYAEEDFLKSLPKRLIIGLATLFLSIATMMIAFGATLVILLSNRFKWTVIPVSLLASVPVTLFALLQFPLFLDIVLSTYGPSIFHKKTESFLSSILVRPKPAQYLGP